MSRLAQILALLLAELLLSSVLEGCGSHPGLQEMVRRDQEEEKYRIQFTVKLTSHEVNSLEYSGESLWMSPGLLYSRYTSSAGELRNTIRVRDRTWIYDPLVEWVTAEEAGLPQAGRGMCDPSDLLSVLERSAEVARRCDDDSFELTLEGTDAGKAVRDLLPSRWNFDLERGDLRLKVGLSPDRRVTGWSYDAVMEPAGEDGNKLHLEARINVLPAGDERPFEFRDHQGLPISPSKAIQGSIEALLRENPRPKAQSAWDITFLNASKPPDSTRGWVMVRMEKFERGLGMVKESHFHYEGDRIGWWEDPPGSGKIVSRHRVFVRGEMTWVDLDTGIELVSVDPRTVIVEAKGCRPILAANGTQTGCTYAVEKRPCEVYDVVYRDAMREKKLTVQDPAVAARSQNFFCAKHLSRPVTTREPKGLGEAALLIEEADRLWETDSEAAIRLYQRLLADFSEAVAALKVRTKVERRAQQGDQ